MLILDNIVILFTVVREVKNRTPFQRQSLTEYNDLGYLITGPVINHAYSSYI